MATRLELSREVAWIKYRNLRPIRDPQREAEVINRMAALAASRGLDIETVRTFFAAQIAASCAEQESLIRGWSRGTRPLPSYLPRELQKSVRQEVDTINLALLDALSRPRTDLQRQTSLHLQRSGFSAKAAKLATAPLAADHR
jgi:chorismate mutase